LIDMALTARQRNKLPGSAFAYPSKRSFPVPTKAQAQRAGIGEGQRQRMLRNASARAAQAHTSGSHRHVQAIAKRRSGSTRGQWDGSQHARKR
jgi:hypothetical protein